MQIKTVLFAAFIFMLCLATRAYACGGHKSEAGNYFPEETAAVQTSHPASVVSVV
jgi:hypothetical protein